ncbi:MAG: TIGR02281 family clan AA aspartic protease [Cognatishimia sp.]|uniref:retropepsin-like aspartic protease family protein n=1 Tax=Cognatishimia sp. TaxID=2211648 RepID=UPI003B8C8EFC
MDDLSIGHLIYLLVLTAMVVFWFFSDAKQSLGKSLQHAVAWGLIILGTIGVISIWDNIESALFGEPQQIVFTDRTAIEITQQIDGHYYLKASLNGAPVDFVVDTGATSIVLSQEDAKRVGFDPDDLKFTGRARTANGVVATASVIVDDFAVGPFRDQNVLAEVNQGSLDISLLGMSYLSNYGQITISGGKMTLTR